MSRIFFALGLSLIGISAPAAETIARSPQTVSSFSSVKETVTSRRFSVDYPDHWILTQNSEEYVIIYNQRPSQASTGEAPPYMIKSDVSILRTCLREALLAYEDEPEQVQRIEAVTVSGRSGVRVWVESEGWDFPNSLTTFVPLSESEVVHISSFYSPENHAAEDAILQMHDTLRLF